MQTDTSSSEGVKTLKFMIQTHTLSFSPLLTAITSTKSQTIMAVLLAECFTAISNLTKPIQLELLELMYRRSSKIAMTSKKGRGFVGKG